MGFSFTYNLAAQFPVQVKSGSTGHREIEHCHRRPRQLLLHYTSKIKKAVVSVTENCKEIINKSTYIWVNNANVTRIVSSQVRAKKSCMLIDEHTNRNATHVESI